MARGSEPGERPGVSFDGLISTAGQPCSMSAVAGERATVLIFTSNGCPTARSYEERLIAFQRRWNDNGVRLVAINSNNPYLSPVDTLEEMARRSAERGFNFPYLMAAPVAPRSPA